MLGPWGCDSFFAQALPSVAAQLAVDRANQDPSLMLGSRLASMVLPMGRDSPSALATFLAHKNTMAAFVGPVDPGYCPAAVLLAQGWGKTLFFWACGDAGGGGELVPTLPLAARTWEGHKTQAQPSLCLWGLLECLSLSGLNLGGACT